ncbi:MAG: AmmeMemoRadiSam system protein A [Gammaproteobacteria bacterium]|jgi:AmmeMemoRadiSam system protein A
MERSFSIEISLAAQRQLLRIARESITHGLASQRPLTIAADDLVGALGEPRATFVTLMQRDMLRGCLGSMEPVRPLAAAVSEAAFGAAFRDSRFPPLRAGELGDTTIHVSVLSDLEPLTAVSEQLLLAQLHAGADGLVLEEGWRRATFLPKVWSQLAEPQAFLRALKQKAGLPPDYWSGSLRFHRYSTHSFSEEQTTTPALA